MDFDTVRTERLLKRFGPTRALAGVSTSFNSGTVTIVEGPNGSGKSTLLSILGQLAVPTGGKVFYGNHHGRRVSRALRRHIGTLAHLPMLYPDLSGRENLELFAKLYQIDGAKRRVDELVHRFNLNDFLERPVRTYSRGQLQRAALSRAVLHAPRLLLLDEPSTGLDIASVHLLVNAVEEEKRRGAIVVVVTHDDAFASQVASSRLALRKGKVQPSQALGGQQSQEERA